MANHNSAPVIAGVVALGIGGGAVSMEAITGFADVDQAAAAAFAAPKVGRMLEAQDASAPTSATATASETSQQQCVSEALARPKITNTEMKHAGVSGTQESYAHVENQAVGQEPDGADCADAGVLRVEKFMFRTQDAEHHARMVSLEPGFFMFNIGNDAGKYTVYLTAGSKDKGLYECTPGPKKTKAEVDIKVAAMDTQSHQALAKRTYKAPITKFFPKAC